MKKTLLAISLLISSNCFSQQDLILPIVRIIDGDTIETRFPLPAPLDEISIRLLGIDTPEMPADSYATTGKLNKAKCVREAELALASLKYLQSMVSSSVNNTMIVRDYDWDKYGRRIDGTVFFGTVDVVRALIENGFGVPYDGTGKRQDWCR